MQWHPIFAALLRPLVQDYYEVQTGLPVGEAPREADIVLLRRTTRKAIPFRALWKRLAPWNVLEFKGPTVDPRLRDLDFLVELGLGIDRRLNEERVREKQPLMPARNVSFWYLANHIGKRFLADTRRKVGQLEALSEGLWRCEILERSLFLVGTDTLPVDRESVPLHLLGRESAAIQRETAQLVVEQKGFWDLYSGWLAYLHPELWEEAQRMARAKGIEPNLDLRPLIDMVGIQQLIDQIGLKAVINAVGLKTVIQEVGTQKILQEMSAEELLSQLTPEKRQALKTLLE